MESLRFTNTDNGALFPNLFLLTMNAVVLLLPADAPPHFHEEQVQRFTQALVAGAFEAPSLGDDLKFQAFMSQSRFLRPGQQYDYTAGDDSSRAYSLKRAPSFCFPQCIAAVEVAECAIAVQWGKKQVLETRGC